MECAEQFAKPSTPGILLARIRYKIRLFFRWLQRCQIFIDVGIEIYPWPQWSRMSTSVGSQAIAGDCAFSPWWISTKLVAFLSEHIQVFRALKSRMSNSEPDFPHTRHKKDDLRVNEQPTNNIFVIVNNTLHLTISRQDHPGDSFEIYADCDSSKVDRKVANTAYEGDCMKFYYFKE